MNPDFSTYLMAAFLGIVEGLTEFLPVSSTGHLILLVDLLGFQGPPGKVFEVVIQLGAILAIVVLYWRLFFAAIISLPVDEKARRFISNILLGFLPAMVFGAAFHSMIKTYLFTPLVVSLMLIAGGIVLVWIERYLPAPRHDQVHEFPLSTALKIGAFQVLAMIPGTSRSGATIIGARIFGVTRKAAAEFSFFLAVPTMAGAAVYDVYKNAHQLDFSGGGLIAVGFLAAFVTAMLTIRWMLGFVQRKGFEAFGWYRILLGTVMLVLLAAR